MNEKLEVSPTPAPISLRDVIAAQALMGMLASDPSGAGSYVDKYLLARRAYEWADAMLAAR